MALRMSANAVLTSWAMAEQLMAELASKQPRGVDSLVKPKAAVRSRPSAASWCARNS